ncbi:hypothetical protein BpHYR1_042078, partial [Brachionus plicatilis]
CIRSQKKGDRKKEARGGRERKEDLSRKIVSSRHIHHPLYTYNNQLNSKLNFQTSIFSLSFPNPTISNAQNFHNHPEQLKQCGSADFQ